MADGSLECRKQLARMFQSALWVGSGRVRGAAMSVPVGDERGWLFAEVVRFAGLYVGSGDDGLGWLDVYYRVRDMCEEWSEKRVFRKYEWRAFEVFTAVADEWLGGNR